MGEADDAVWIEVVGREGAFSQRSPGGRFDLQQLHGVKFILGQIIAPGLAAGEGIMTFDQMPVLAPESAVRDPAALAERVLLRSGILHRFAIVT